MNPRISVLISARKNSKYLAKFMFGLFHRTFSGDNVEILVMLNQDDTWNEELARSITNNTSNVTFFKEDFKLGRAGLHKYFNELYKHAKGDWIVYFCEDHFIIMDNWDLYVLKMIDGTMKAKQGSSDQPIILKHDFGVLDPKEPWCLIPKFDNCGAMNQILSRGYIEAMGGMIGKHGWIDSYINDVNVAAFGDVAINRPNFKPNDRVIRFDDEMFHDFTHDHPNPMEDAHMQSVISEEGKLLPKYGAPEVKELIKQDAERIKAALNELSE